MRWGYGEYGVTNHHYLAFGGLRNTTLLNRKQPLFPDVKGPSPLPLPHQGNNARESGFRLAGLGQTGPGPVVVFVLGADPGVGQVRHFAQQQKVIAVKKVRRFPLAFVFIQAAEGHTVTGAIFGFVLPNCGLDEAESDLLNRFCFEHINENFKPKN